MQNVKKHTDILTLESIQNILRQQGDICLTIYMPIERHTPQTRQNPIRLKNLVTIAKENLIEFGLSSNEADEFLSPIANDTTLDFFDELSDGLVLFITPGSYFIYQMPYSFDEFVFVGQSFYIRPLISLLAEGDEFYVLALNRGQVRLLRGNRYQIGEIDIEGAPQSLSEALQYDDFERQVQFHSVPQNSTRNADAQFHGHGDASSDSIQTENTLRFFRALDNGVCDYLKSKDKAPLILAGVDELRGLYRQANHYHYLTDEEIDSDPQAVDETQLHERAWDILRPYISQNEDEAIDQYNEFAVNKPKHATSALEHIVQSAYYQRIAVLFLPKDGEHWGVFEPSDDTLTVHQQYQVGDQDLLNEAAIHTIMNGGKVHVLENDRIPSDGDVASAILRY